MATTQSSATKLAPDNADRQLNVYEQGNSFSAVVDYVLRQAELVHGKYIDLNVYSLCKSDI